jgi:hypothetical protein
MENFLYNTSKVLCHNLVLYELEDVLEVLSMFMLKNFLDRFVFLWGREQGCKMFNEITPEFYYYLKDLKHVYYVCHGYFMGRKIKHY